MSATSRRQPVGNDGLSVIIQQQANGHWYIVLALGARSTPEIRANLGALYKMETEDIAVTRWGARRAARRMLKRARLAHARIYYDQKQEEIV